MRLARLATAAPTETNDIRLPKAGDTGPSVTLWCRLCARDCEEVRPGFLRRIDAELATAVLALQP